MNNPVKLNSQLMKFVVAAAAVGGLLLANITWGPEHRDSVVVKVYDGDTIRLDNGDKVRLIGIDTPERHESDKLYADARRLGKSVEEVKAMGDAAYEYANRWLAGQRVRLKFDKEKRDKYGRLLAYVYLPFPRPPLSNSPRAGYIVSLDEKKWYFINATIIQAGYAVPMPIKPNTMHEEEFQLLFEQAKENKHGLWADAPAKTRQRKRR